MRLIDADKLYKELEDIRMDYIDEDSMSSKFAADVIETVQDEYLRKSPTVDAVEVVRCRQCKHCDPENYHCDHPMGTVAPLRREPDDFCSYGERKDCGGNG